MYLNTKSKTCPLSPEGIIATRPTLSPKTKLESKEEAEVSRYWTWDDKWSWFLLMEDKCGKPCDCHNLVPLKKFQAKMLEWESDRCSPLTSCSTSHPALCSSSEKQQRMAQSLGPCTHLGDQRPLPALDHLSSDRCNHLESEQKWEIFLSRLLSVTKNSASLTNTNKS